MKWLQSIKKAETEYKDMVYNAHSVMRDYWSYDEILHMPLRNIIEEINYFMPKLKEIAKRQEEERVKAELAGKRNMKQPGGRR